MGGGGAKFGSKTFWDSNPGWRNRGRRDDYLEEGCKKSMSQLDTGVHGEGVEEIRDLLQGGDSFWASGDTCCLVGVGLAMQCQVLAVCFVGAFLGAADTFSPCFLFLAFLLVLAVCALLGATATAAGVGCGGGADGALATRPPRRTWFEPSPRLSCSADGSGRVGTDRTAPFGAPLFATDNLQALPWNSSHSPQPR
jgi:hypothetical protein